MTKIAIVRGLNDNKGRPIPEQMPFLNWLTATSGEFDLHVAKQRLWLFHHLIPQKEKIWAKGAVMIDNALSNGIHGLTPYIGYVPNELKFVAQTLKQAKNRIAPAGEILLRSTKDLSKGVDLDAVGSADLIKTDYQSLYSLFPHCFNINLPNAQNGWKTTYDMKGSCDPVLRLLIDLNKTLPKSAHHYLYQFIADANNTTQTASGKALQHRLVNGELNKITSVSMPSLIEWQRNAIVWRNANKGAEGVVTPEMVIEMLMKNPNMSIEQYWNQRDDDKIGGFVLTAAIIWALVGAIVAITGLVQACKGKEPTAFQYLAGIGTQVFSAEGLDFKGLGNGSGSQSDNDKNNDSGKEDEEEEEEDGKKTGIMKWVSDNPIPTAIGAGLALYGLTKK